MAVLGLILIGLSGIAMAAFLMTVKSALTFYILFDLFIIAFGCYLIIEAWFRKIRIDNKGVVYTHLNKKIQIKWEDIEHVDIRGLNLGRGRIDALCFFTKSSDYTDINPKNIGTDFIMMLNINKNVIEEIKRYWNGEIGGLEYFN